MQTDSTHIIGRVRHYIKVVLERGALAATGKGGLNSSRMPACLRDDPNVEYRQSSRADDANALLSINRTRSIVQHGTPSDEAERYGGPFLDFQFFNHTPWTEVLEKRIVTKRMWPLKPKVTIERDTIIHAPTGPFFATISYSNPTDLCLGSDSGRRGVYLGIRFGIPEEEAETFLREVSANPNLIRYLAAFFFPTEGIFRNIMNAAHAEKVRLLVFRPGVENPRPQDIPFNYAPPDPDEFQKLLTDPVL